MVWRNLITAVGLSFTLATARQASAHEPEIACEVRTIHALHDGGGIDPKITRIRKYLEQPPFTSWNHFKLIGQKDFSIGPGGSDSFDLPTGRHAKVGYVAPLHPNGKHRLRLQLTVTEGAKEILNTVFVLNDEGVIMQAGQRYLSGMLILGISCDYPD